MLRAHGRSFAGYSITLTESHQAAKTSEAATALAFADALNFPPAKIHSIRDASIQQYNLEIPVEYLDRHAYHYIVIHDGTDEVTIQTKVLGHQSYARGVKAIVEAVMGYQLENKRYQVLDLIDLHML